MNALLLFLRFAYPCSFQSIKEGKITDAERAQLLEMALDKRELDARLIKKAFPAAIARLSSPLESVSEEGVYDYFFGRHNELAHDLPAKMSDWCKARECRVIEVNASELVVEQESKRFNVKNEWLEVKPGDSVVVHRGFAVEKTNRI
ncbi:MAG: hypothetical protein V1834_01035 [Candidatus Micrarchaeota archaeon]